MAVPPELASKAVQHEIGSAASAAETRAQAASAAATVQAPRWSSAMQVAAIGGSDVGIAGLIRVIRTISSVSSAPAGSLAPGTGSVPSVPHGRGESEPMGTGTRYVSVGGVLKSVDSSVIGETAYWLAYANAAYKPSMEHLVQTLQEMGAEDVDILHAQLAPMPLVQAHFLARDRRKKAIVLAIRGTASMKDVVADMAARPIPFGGGSAHTGMAAAVDGLLHYAIQPDFLADKVQGAAVSSNAEQDHSATSQTPGLAPDHQRPPVTSAGSMPAPRDLPASSAIGFTCPFVESMARQSQLGGVSASTTAPAYAPPAAGFSPYARIPALESIGLAGVAVLIQRALHVYPDHRLVITGHSLGAGIAALLTAKIVRIVLFLRRQQLQAEADLALAQEAAASDASLPRSIAPAIRYTSDLEYFLPERPIQCYAYAAPACMSPELAMLYAVSLHDMEKCLLADRLWLEHICGEQKAKSLIAAHEAKLDAEAQQRDKGQERLDNVGPASWPALRKLPMITSVVFGDDIVPRLTVSSLKDLADRLAVHPYAETSSVAPPQTVVEWLKRLWLALCGWCGGAAVKSSVPAVTATAQTVAEPVEHSLQRQGDVHMHASVGGLDMSTSYSLMMEPLARVESEEARQSGAADELSGSSPADSMLATATAATLAAQARAFDERDQYEQHLLGTGVPYPLVQFILSKLQSHYAAPTQLLVAPGIIYFVYKLPPAATDPQNMRREAGETAIVLGAPDTGQLRYSARRVTPSELERIVLSPSMVTDHMVPEYMKCLAALKS